MRYSAEDAARVLDSPVYDYVEAGAGQEITARRNVTAWRRHWLVPRVLRDIAACDPATTLLGRSVRLPVGVAPTGRHLLIHPDGEVGTASAAAANGVPYILSFFSTQSLEQVATAAGDGVRWLQVPMGLARAEFGDVSARAHAAGYSALVVTVDQPVGGHSPRTVRNPVIVPEDLRLPHLPGAPRAIVGFDDEWERVVALSEQRTFEDLAAWAAQSPLPLVVKGVLNPADAIACIEAGAAAILVSNHGGRHLDQVAATADVLAGIVAAVDGRAEVYVDGGIRSVADVLVALCLGADAVFLGRPWLWALAVGGAEAVATSMADLQARLVTDMKLLGTPDVGCLGRHLLTGPDR